MKYVKEDKRKQRRLEKLLRKMKNSPHVAVGVLQDKPHENGIGMVELALIHEYGTKDGHIPARSFLGSTCDAKRKEHLQLITKLQGRILDSKMSVRQALVFLGEVVSKDVVQAINGGIEPRLKESTIKRKKSSKPLIDKGHLKGTITHEVRGAT